MAKAKKTKETEKVKQKRVQYSEEAMELAILAVQNNRMTRAVAARKYEVPYSTLYDRLLGRRLRTTRLGHPTYLTKEEEQQIVR